MITVYHDSFKVTAPEKVRIHACMLLDEFELAWNSQFLWMNENGYHYRKEEFPYEIYHNNFKEHPEKKCLVDFCIPII